MADKFKTSAGPCKDCADRCVNCHASCEKYLSWKKDCDKASKDYIDALNSSRITEEYYIKKIQKNRKMKPIK